jgi:stearoyl-CoA desaturase (delta-9 desaturase)
MNTTLFILVFGIGSWYLSLFFHSFYSHRYVTHGEFQMSQRLEKICWVLTWLFQGPAYLDIVSYAIMHLQHHEFSDTEKDPHSPIFSSKTEQGLDFLWGVWPFMWKTKKTFTKIHFSRAYRERSYNGWKLPSWRGFEKFANSGTNKFLFGLVYIFLYAWLAPHWWLWFLLPINLTNGPIQGAIVNWFGHKLGYRNYPTPDNSHNTLIWDFPLLGELFQNNHHKNPKNPNFARKKFELDPLYSFGIKPLVRMGIIKLNPT